MSAVIDRLPPQNTDAEEAVLGSIIMSGDALNRVGDLSPRDFYREKNRQIFEAMLAIAARNEPVDFLTVSDELRRREKYDEIGGLSYLTRLIEIVPTAVHVEHYAGIVHDTAVRRRLISASAKIAQAAYDETLGLEDVLIQVSEILAKVSTDAQTDDIWTPERQIEDFRDYIDDLVAGRPAGLRTSLSFHKLTRGYRRGSLYVVGAVSGLGKTAWMASEARDLVLRGHKVHFASSEMSALELIKRYAASVMGRDWNRVEEELERSDEYPGICLKVEEMIAEIGAFLPIVYHAGSMTVEKIRRRVSKQMMDGGCDIVFVDYLQRLKPSSSRQQNRYRDVDDISMDLKTLAEDLNIPVVVAAQFNLNKVMARDDKTPRDDDFRESGGIYQEADVALGLHRDSRYADTADPHEAWIYVMKNRHGQADRRFRMVWLPDTVQYVDPDAFRAQKDR